MEQGKAKRIYDTMVKALNAKEWHFDEKPEDLTIVSGYTGDDLPIRFIIHIDEKREAIRFLSPMPFTFPEDKRIDAAVAVCVANDGMVNGSFDLDLDDGQVSFRLTTSYCGCEIGEDFFMDMMGTALTTADHYNDRFFALAKGLITLQKFIEQERQ